MALAINNNLMANNVTRNLQGHYSKLGDSTQRLSSGLRVNSAADDAAGLAIRELMRADVAALNQGVRNANDGISLIQTADGALGVIDSKLIRMKELAEQAATSTYTDAQRSIINDEYQSMANEITRIAEDTDFNGQKLLNGGDMGDKAVKAANADTGAIDPKADGGFEVAATAGGAANVVNVTNEKGALTSTVTYSAAGAASNTFKVDADGKATIIAGAPNVTVKQETTLDLTKASDITYSTRALGSNEWSEASSTEPTMEDGMDLQVTYTDEGGNKITFTVDTADDKELSISTTGDTLKITAEDDVTVATATPPATVDLDAAPTASVSLQTESFNIHFGSSQAAQDSYDVSLNDATAAALGIGSSVGDDLTTADNAKAALDHITNAIEKKDAIRANIGATQNRLEATIENISIQKENLQAAESRISDVDVATEMTEFSKQQILANAAVSMLSQANNLPQMAQKLIG